MLTIAISKQGVHSKISVARRTTRLRMTHRPVNAKTPQIAVHNSNSVKINQGSASEFQPCNQMALLLQEGESRWHPKLE